MYNNIGLQKLKNNLFRSRSAIHYSGYIKVRDKEKILYIIRRNTKL